MTETERKILSIIPRGNRFRITQKEITRATGIYGHTTRKAINSLRSDFVPICSDRYGYFIADDPNDISDTMADINSRIHMMIRAREGLAKAQRIMSGEAEVM